LLIAFGALVMVGSGLTVVVPKLVAHWALGNVPQQNVIPPELKGADISGAINFLLVGSDARDPDAAVEDATSPIRSDSIMLVHIPADHSKVYMISFPRDMRVDIPADPRTGIAEHVDRINSAFAQAAVDDKGARDATKTGYGNGAVFLMKTISNIVSSTGGLKFNGWATINFDGFDKVVQVLGGVHMCFDEDVYSIHYWPDGESAGDNITKYEESHNGTNPDTGFHYPKGQCWDLQPWQALDYSRQRVGLPNGDYDRQRHQQQLLKAIVNKVASTNTMTNFNTIKNLQQAVGDMLNLDLGGKNPEDWVITLKNLRADDMVMIQTNGANPYASVTDGGTYVGEQLEPAMVDLLKHVQTDSVIDFLAQHPDWVAKDPNA
jgi:LCP family protein required for cell wall assembly